MTISIIIPFKNSAATLKRCIDSVRKQTYKNIEIILINNNSNDLSKKIATHALKKDTRIKLFNEKKGGVSSARNLGIKKSKGDQIFFIDSDDFISKKTLKELFDFSIKNNLDLMIGNHAQVRNKKKIIKNKMIKKNIIFNNRSIKTYLLKLFKVHYKFLIFTHCWCKLYNNNLIKKHNLKFDINMSQLEDTNFNFEYMRYTNKIGFLKKNYYYHVIESSAKNHRESYKINPSIIYCLKSLFFSIKKFIKSKKLDNNKILIKHLKHMIFSIFVIFILRIFKKNDVNKFENFLKIIKLSKKSKFLNDLLKYYRPNRNENSSIPLLIKKFEK